MIKMTTQLIAWLYGRFIRSSTHAAFAAWFRANVCAPEPVPVRQYAKQARIFFEEISPECVIVRSRTYEQVLIYSFDKEKWECNCLTYGVFGVCAHTIAARKALLPVRVLVIGQ